LDGYRALAFKKSGKVHLRSRNDNDFNARYPGIGAALAPLPNDTLIDGEVVALDEDGRPSFNTLQNYGSAGAPLHFYVFDLLVLEGRDVTNETLETRRKLLEKRILPKLSEPIRYSPVHGIGVGLKTIAKGAAPVPKRGVGSKRRKRRMSAEGRKRIAAAQKKRWAAVRKTAKKRNKAA
jgi:bifunctional non-homologous end joining protein LigD